MGAAGSRAGPAPPPPAPEQQHVVVVGAGFVGVATAHQLLRDGHRVTCIEAGEAVAPAHAASHTNGALLCPSLTRPWCNRDILRVAAWSLLCPEVLRGRDETVHIEPRLLLERPFWRWAARFVVEAVVPSRLEANFRHSYLLSQFSVHTVMSPDHGFGWPRGELYGRTAHGTLQLFAGEADAAACAASVGTAAALGCHLEQLGPAQTQARLAAGLGAGPQQPRQQGEGVQQQPVGLWSRDDSNGDIRQATALLHRECLALGGAFRLGQRAVGLVEAAVATDDSAPTAGEQGPHRPAPDTATTTDMDTDSEPAGSGLRRMAGVRLAGGEVVWADHIVVAAGNDAQRLADQTGDQLHILPVRGLVITVPLAAGASPVAINVCDDDRKLYLAPVADAAHLGFPHGAVRLSGCALFGDSLGGGGGGGFEWDAGPFPRDVREDRMAQTLLHGALAGLPAGLLDPGRAVYRRCWRPQTPDDLPVIGRSAAYANVWFNAGHGHLGWTRGAGAARLLADALSGRDHHSAHGLDPAAFRPARFLSSY